MTNTVHFTLKPTVQKGQVLLRCKTSCGLRGFRGDTHTNNKALVTCKKCLKSKEFN